ncbi:histidine phosphatase family protein [soil metagenome]
MRLLLVRHGQTPANVEGRLNTAAPGPGLTRLGEEQAAMIPVALRDTPVDGIYASLLVRTQLTAQPLADDRGLDLQVLDGVHEIEAGDLEDLRDRASVRAYLRTSFAWGSGDLSVVMPGGTDGHAFFHRFDADIARVAAEAENAVVVSHGSAIRVWVAGRATNVPRSFAGEHELDNTGVVELDGSPELGWTLLAWQGIPIGGAQLADPTAEDPTGETLEQAE